MKKKYKDMIVNNEKKNMIMMHKLQMEKREKDQYSHKVEDKFYGQVLKQSIDDVSKREEKMKEMVKD